MTHSSSTIEEVFRSYEQVNVDLAETTLSHTKRALDLFMEYLRTKRHSLQVAEVGRDEVQDWRAWLIREKDPEGHPRFESSTVNSYLRSAAPVFRWLTQRKNPVIAENPFRCIKYVQECIPVLEYTKDEVTALLDVSDTRWKGMIIVACTAGLARGEILNLTWPDIDCTRNRIIVRNKQDDPAAGIWKWDMKRRGKDRRPIELPVSPKIDGILQELQAGLNVNQPYPFIWGPRYWDLKSQIGYLSRRVRNCPDSNFDREFESLCRRASVDKGKRDFHDLRKTAITNWTRTPGLAPQDMQRLARHASWETTARYAAVNPAAAQIAEQHSFV